ncbi:unnamed protein product [Acanthoscelides obtectus]|uniref:DDE Tnp4 domain-containing protein n=1 Tax=Acanthoscelides obtectus TaxID=200917 RepID=A0A9P0MDL8_ACAOB|nr:unnamed protein product [Acanthoscelides obtectus]CAK1630942.1 Putative nuclease HARBI1 [Acanthoscelides obtectus]
MNVVDVLSNEWIKFPTTNHELMEAKRIWPSMYKFPTAIGVIDCTHIGILKPSRHGDEYINRKRKPTLNVQATCDAREMFTSVAVSWPGSVHDSRIWRNPQTGSQLINKANALLRDDGYGIEPCLMTPFRNPTPGSTITGNQQDSSSQTQQDGFSLQQLLQQREEENRQEVERLTAEIRALKLQLLQFTNGK